MRTVTLAATDRPRLKPQVTRPRLIRPPPPPPEQDTQPARRMGPFTTRFEFVHRDPVIHKSMSTSWDGALELALRAVRREHIIPDDACPTSIVVLPG